MIAHPVNTARFHDTAAILQLNCRRSPPVLHSLFNDQNTTNFLILSLQEPPVNTYTNLLMKAKGGTLLLTAHRT